MLLTYKEAAQKLRIAETTLRAWVSQRKIPYLKLGRVVRFDLEALERWLHERSVPTGGTQ